MESQILEGQAIQTRVQTILVNSADLDDSLVRRVQRVKDAVMTLTVGKKQRICVLDSGIDPELSFGPSKKQLAPLDKPIRDALGNLPELDFPTEDVPAVVAAWEDWITRYIEEALKVIEQLNSDPPAAGKEEFMDTKVSWGEVTIWLADDLRADISPGDGAKAIRDARAGHLWNWAATRHFSSDSVAAAREAVAIPPTEAQFWLEALEPAEIAARSLDLAKRRYQAAKAHDTARSAKVPDFDVEMRYWAEKRGSERLRLGIEDGYRMNARYLAERIAAEAPGMFAMPASSATEDWASKAASPSEAALRLRRRVAAAIERYAPPNLEGPPKTEILIIRKPPPDIYRADPGIQVGGQTIGSDLPDREGWPWYIGDFNQPIGSKPTPIEAVVVKDWLGRFYLIGAVVNERHGAPLGIWAIPDPDLYEEDGTVIAQDPDNPTPPRARRKPPDPPESDDIPF
jgi:hypothetical protein